MKKIGIIGGLAWPSTAEYYRLICSGANAHFRGLGHPMPLPTPPITIESVNMAETRELRGKPDGTGWDRFDAVFLDMYYLGRLIPRGGIVILDDYHWPGVHRAVSFYVKNRDWTIEEIVEDHSVVLRTAREPDTQDGRYFVEF